MKKILTLGIAMISVLSGIAADKVKIEDLYYNLNKNNKTAEVTYDTDKTPTLSNPSYSDFSEKELTIPATIEYDGEEYSVNSIGKYAFEYCTGLTSISFSENIKSVGYNAFYYCNSLKEVKIPSFEAWCNIRFDSTSSNPNYYAENLMINGKELSGQIKLPSDWTEVPVAQFAGCKSVTEFIFPENLVSIGDYTFSLCRGLTSVSFPENLNSIGNYAFYNCTSLTSIPFPENLNSIGSYAFYNCTGLNTISFHENINSIDSYAFFYCKSLKQVNIPSLDAWCKIKFSGEYANPIQYSNNLLINGEEISGQLRLPSDLTEVSNYQFYGCKAVTEFIFPECLISIGDYAFGYCTDLTSVSFPESLTTIGKSAFSQCESLKEVNTLSFETWCNIKFDNFLANPNYYAKNLLINGKELSGRVVLPSEWTEVPVAQFECCDAVTEFILPENLVSIKDYAFYNCNSLVSVSLPEGLTSIEESGFRICRALTSISMPESLNSIGNYAFQSCSGLTSIKFPKKINSFGSSVLSQCTNLTSVSLPEGITTIDGDFSGCSNLTKVSLPESLTHISSYTFQNCKNLEKIILPLNINYLGVLVFNNCSSLLKVVSLNNTPPDNYGNTFMDPALSTGVLYVPESSLDDYKNTNYWNKFQNIEPIILASGLELSTDKNPLTVGHSQQIKAILTPENATINQFNWSSSDESVATIDQLGNVCALKAGRTTIIAKTIDGSGIEASYTLNVTESNGNLSIDDFEICIGEEMTVPVNLDMNFNDCRYAAFQFDVTLPEGIILENAMLGDEELEAGMELKYKTQENGAIRFIVTPTENLDGIENLDNLMLLNLKAKETAEPGNASILISNASLSTVKGADVFLDNSTANVILRVLLLGDANDNGTVTVADVVTIANFIAKKDIVNWCFVNADVNRDKQITTADITGTVNIIAGEEISPVSVSRKNTRQHESDRLIADNFTPIEGESFKIGFHLDNTRDYSALQASVIIPEGMTVEGVSKGSQAASHTLIHNITVDGRVEVVVFSTSNKPFSATDGSLFELEVRADQDCGDLMTENILASDATAIDYVLRHEGGKNAGVITSTDSFYTDSPKISIYSEGIVVTNACGHLITVFSVTGEVVAIRKAQGDLEKLNLSKGLYIVTIGSNSYKIKI